MPTFFVAADSVVPPTVRITDPLLHHLRQSLRLQPGETLTVTDGAGRRYRTEIDEITTRHLTARILETTTAPPKTSPSIVLAQALLKGEKMDWIIQKATELGVDRIAPVVTTHGVVKPRAERLDHQRARWQRIALEAAQQSERWSVPTIDEPATLSQFMTGYAAPVVTLFLAERSSGASLTEIAAGLGAEQTVVIVVGPEGGWGKEELRLAHARGCQTVTMGNYILRAETAALAAISVLQARFGELG
jgi:16S rRNA (uracil1498-N3)-methyltransferase